MEDREDALEAKNNCEVIEVVEVRPVAEVPVTEIAEAVPQVILAQSPQGTHILEEEERAKDSDNFPLQKNGKIHQIIECLLFVSNEPLTLEDIAEALEMEKSEVQIAIESFEKHLDNSSGLQLMRVAGGYQLCTRPEYADYCAKVLKPAKKKLSKAALETLAVIAYRQPCTMPEVEAVRGVSVDGVMKTLADRGLIKEAGRKQAPGRPILYATTPEFLEYFGLNDLSELPDIDMLAVEEVKALETQRELLLEEVAKEEKNAQDGVNGGED